MFFQNGNFFEQSDNKLIDLIEAKYLIPPSEENYNLNNPNKEHSMGQAQTIMKILKNQVQNKICKKKKIRFRIKFVKKKI